MANTVIETRYGKVRGSSLGTVTVWKGIPFAQPPIDQLRFRPPQPPAPWPDVRDAMKFGPIAVQSNSPLSRLFGTGNAHIEMDEDCLYLNIWSPGTEGKARPVLVWIHGGGFTGGSGSTPWYDGEAFAAHGDIVVVTINYRLGVPGFLYLGDVLGEEYAASGNNGILDQVAALEWVRDNIAAFGGDPGNVTIVGESAGAMSIAVLMAMPAARGLFQRAILQSGAGHAVAGKDVASKVTQSYLRILGLKDAASLVNLPVDTLLSAQGELFREHRLALRPVVDGVVLFERPIDAIAHGSADGVTTLIGTTRDEMKLFTTMDPQQATPDENVLTQLFGASAKEVLATYAAAHANNLQTDGWVDILTDRTFRIPAIRLAEQQAERGTGVWMYRFDWASSAFEGRLGACHALEIPFVWDNLGKPGVTIFTGDAPTRQPLAHRMHAAWIAFLHTGDPNTADLPEWPVYDVKRRATMIFDTTCQIVDDPQATERRYWETVL